MAHGLLSKLSACVVPVSRRLRSQGAAAARLMEEARLKLSGARRRRRDLGRLLAATNEHLRTTSGSSHCAGGTEKLSEQLDERGCLTVAL